MKYLMLLAFVTFSVGQVSFAQDIEGSWKLAGVSCVNFDKNEVSQFSEDIVPKSLVALVDFTKNENNSTESMSSGNFKVTAIQAVTSHSTAVVRSSPPFSSDLFRGVDPYDYEETEVVAELESCTVDGGFLASGQSLNVTADFLSVSGECVAEEEEAMLEFLKSSGITAKLTLGGINYFIESDQLHIQTLVGSFASDKADERVTQSPATPPVLDEYRLYNKEDWPLFLGKDTTEIADIIDEIMESNVGPRVDHEEFPHDDYYDDDFSIFSDLPDCGDSAELAIVLEKM